MSLMAQVDQARSSLQAANERLLEARGLLDNLIPGLGAAVGAAVGGDVLTKHQRFDRTLSYMHMEMVTNINEVDSIRVLNKAGYLSDKAKLAALAAWAWKVRPGGEWDHKPKLREMLEFNNESFTFPIPGDDEHEYSYDIWSNIHYGYVGKKAGFHPHELQAGAQLADKGIHVPADALSIQIGMELWEKYGPNLTPEQLHQAILDHKEEYLRIQNETNIVVRPIDNGR